MSSFSNLDEEYLARISDALVRALFSASMISDHPSQAVFRSAEITDAALDIIAFASATSSAVENRAKKREFLECVSNRLGNKITLFRNAHARGELGFLTVMPEKTN